MDEIAVSLGRMKSCISELSKEIERLEDEVNGAKQNEADKELTETVSLEQIRAVLAKASRDGKTEQVKRLIGAHGANRLSEVAPKEFSVMLEEVESWYAT